MEHLLVKWTQLSLEFALCAMVVLGGSRLISQRYRDGKISTIVPDSTGRNNSAQAVNWPDESMQMQQPSAIFHTDESGCPMAVINKPMLLAKMEAESAAITTRVDRESRLRSLTGMQDVGRLTEVMEETLIPLMIRELSPSGLALSGLMSSYDQHLLASLVEHSSVASIKLSEFTGRHTFGAVTGALFGPTFPSASVFEDYFFLMQNGEQGDTYFLRWMPLKRRVDFARGRLVKAFSLYLEEWWYADGLHTIPGISRLAERLLHGAKDEELDLEEASCALLFFLVEAHLNLWTTTTCLISHILSDSTVHRSVVEDVQTHSDYFSSRLLESATNEVLRWNSGPPSRRHLTDDAVFTVNRVPQALKSGTKIVLDLTGLHFDVDVYADPDRFDVERFRNEYLPLPRPFGEGRHMCKGGHLAKLQIKSFIYHVFRRFDLQVDLRDAATEPRHPPSPSSSHCGSRLGSGMIGSRKVEDIWIDVRVV